MQVAGVAEGDRPVEKAPEADKTTVAKLLFGFTGLYERWRNELEARRHPSGRFESDLEERLRRLEGWRADVERSVSYGNNNPQPARHRHAQVWEIAVRIGVWVLTAAVGFAFGRLWDHEHRISVLEGREVPHVGSP